MEHFENNTEHKHNSIEKHLITRIPIVSEDYNIKKVLQILEKSKNKYDSIDYIYVTDDNEDLIGMFYIQELFNNHKNKSVKNIMHRNVVTVSLHTELEKVAHLALIHNLKQIPVARHKKIIGVVSSRQILSTINKSLKKDIFHSAGIHKSHLEYENSLDIPLFKSIKDRLSWLIIGLFGAIFMAAYIGMFEETLSKSIIIGAFVPAIVYISGAMTNQFGTIFVRDLAVMGNSINIKKYFLKQGIIGFFISAIIGIVLFSIISLIWKNPHIAFVIAISCFITLMLTEFIALIIPLLIKRFKFDPALGSGPISTIISDLSSVVIYFLMVIWLL